jgi:hypothetical protein
MIRWLLGTCAVLAALCAFQWRTIGHLEEDLKGADGRAYRAALVELHDRRDEVTRVLAWLDAYGRDGSTRPEFSRLCHDEVFDAATAGRLVFDVYLRARADGESEATARQRVIDSLRNTKSGS